MGGIYLIFASADTGVGYCVILTAPGRERVHNAPAFVRHSRGGRCGREQPYFVTNVTREMTAGIYHGSFLFYIMISRLEGREDMMVRPFDMGIM